MLHLQRYPCLYLGPGILCQWCILRIDFRVCQILAQHSLWLGGGCVKLDKGCNSISERDNADGQNHHVVIEESIFMTLKPLKEKFCTYLCSWIPSLTWKILNVNNYNIYVENYEKNFFAINWAKICEGSHY